MTAGLPRLEHLTLDGDGVRLHAVAAGPASLAEWTEFHQQVERLPDEAREVFDLVWYEGLSQVEAAALLGVPLRTLKRRWRAARELLSRALYGEPPDG